MQLQEVKATKFQLNDINLEIERTTHAKRIVFKDRGGRVLLIVSEGKYSGLDIHEPAPPKMKKVYRAIGKVLGQTVSEDFESLTMAEAAISELPANSESSIEEVEVADEQG